MREQPSFADPWPLISNPWLGEGIFTVNERAAITETRLGGRASEQMRGQITRNEAQIEVRGSNEG